MFLLRGAFHRIAPVKDEQPSVVPPIVNLAKTDASRKRIYDSLRAAMLAPATLWAAAGAALLITVLDSWSTFSEILSAEKGHRMWFDFSGDNPTADVKTAIAFTGYAYLVEFTAIFLGLLFAFLLARHNLFFLSHVYQRRAVQKGDEENYFEIDIYDPNRCFGFRKANDAFNTQVIFLMLGGLLMLASRYATVSTADTQRFWETDFLPTTGQVLLVASWLLAFVIVMLPSLVKLLPRLPRFGCPPAPSTITGYLREFIPDESWPFDPNQEPKASALRALAGQFARNAFWPTGNNRASQLFQFAFVLFLVILFPLPLHSGYYTVGYLVAMCAGAYLLKLAFFAVLNWSLEYIDPALVTPLPDGAEDLLPKRRFGKLRCKVFINYRRSDSKAYAGHLHRTLREHLDENQIFMDIEDIAPGEVFSNAISTSLDQIDALIVLIGPTWLTVEKEDADGQQRRRLDFEDDYVRAEIHYALERGIRVFPLLVNDAKMPPGGFLPSQISRLSLINAIQVSDERWDYDVGRLIEALLKLDQTR